MLLTEFKICPTARNDYFLPTEPSKYIKVLIFKDRESLNQWERENTTSVDESAEEVEFNCFFTEVYESDDPALFGLMFLHLESLSAHYIVHLSVMAATRFLDTVNLNGWRSFDRDVIAETSSAIASQVVDELYDRGVLEHSGRG